MKTSESQIGTVITHDRKSLVDEIISAAGTAAQPAGASFVGECTDTRHPALTGRVRVEWRDPENRLQGQWLPCLQGLTVRESDRVLVQCPGNWPEPIVVGVVDGFAVRPEAKSFAGPALTLEKDEALRVDTRDGQPLLEIRQDENGPVVRLLTDDVNLEIKGRFKIGARSIDLRARQGDIKITASDDVKVEGEMIKLN